MGGVHVFQSVFQRLPTKHKRFHDIAITPDAFFWLAQEAAFAPSLKHNVAATVCASPPSDVALPHSAREGRHSMFVRRLPLTSHCCT